MVFNMQVLVDTVQQLVDEKFNGNATSASVSCGLNKTYVRDLLQKGKVPKIEALIKLAEGLGVTVSQLVGEVQLNDKLYIIGRVPSGVPLQAIEETTEYIHYSLGDKKLVGVIIDDDSMDRIAPKGAIVAFDQDQTDQEKLHGCLVIVDNVNQVLFRRLDNLNGILTPESNNKTHENVRPLHGFKILGKVVSKHEAIE